MATITNFAALREILPHPVAHRVGGEVFPFRVPRADLSQVVEQARHHPKVRIANGQRGDRLSQSLQSPAEDFRRLPLDLAVRSPVHLSIFELDSLAGRAAPSTR